MYTVAHGFGVVPRMMRAASRCVANDAATTLVIGQEFNIVTIWDANDAILGNLLFADSTNIYLATSSYYNGSNNTITIPNGGTPLLRTVSSFNNFRLVLYALSF